MIPERVRDQVLRPPSQGVFTFANLGPRPEVCSGFYEIVGRHLRMSGGLENRLGIRSLLEAVGLPLVRAQVLIACPWWLRNLWWSVCSACKIHLFPKNGVNGDEYVLLTEEFESQLDSDPYPDQTEHVEHYNEIGTEAAAPPFRNLPKES